MEAENNTAPGGFNPLSLLSAPISGGIPPLNAASSADSRAYQDVFVNSPFNVGEGSLTSAAGTASPDSIQSIMQQLLPLAGMVLATWAIVTVIKK